MGRFSRTPRPKQPKIEIPRTRLEISLEICAAAVVIFLIIYLPAAWVRLPDRIPTHFNFSGQVDNWGSKFTLLPLVGIVFVMYAGMSILQRFPQIYNYPVTLTDTNRRQQYLLARQLIASKKTELVCLFAYLIWRTIEVARGNAINLSGWFLPIFLVIILGTTIVYFVAARRAR